MKKSQGGRTRTGLFAKVKRGVRWCDGEGGVMVMVVMVVVVV